MDRTMLAAPSKVLSYYLVNSMDTSDRLLKKHGISKLNLY